MVEQEIKVQSRKEVEKERESARRSRDRKRSWDPDTYTLGKGIISEDDIEVSSESSPEELMKVIQYLKKQNSALRTKLKEKVLIDKKEVQTFCNKNGYRTFQDYLKNVNAINAAEKGNLFQNQK